MQRLIPVALAAALLAASAVAARNPHDPQEKLNAADNATARAIVIHKSDLVGAWKATRSSPEDSRCKTFDPDMSDLTLTGKADSPDFERNDGVSVSSSVEVYETAAQLRASFDRFAKPPVVKCIDAAFRREVRPAKVTTLIARRAPVPRYGDRTARYQFVWAVAGKQATVKAYTEVYLLGNGRNGVTIFLFSTPAQVPAAAQRDLVERVANRM